MGLTHSPFVPPPPAIDAAAEEEEKEEERWAGSGASPSLPPRSHLTYTYVWCTRLRLPLAPGNEITITAASTDVRECALAGLGPATSGRD